jgi:hypothetical protein
MDANQERHPRDGGSKLPGFWRSRAAIGLIIFFVIGTFLLTSEHRAHVFGMLPYLLLLACPLLHVFMHGGHGRHGRHGPGDSKPGSEDRS